MTLNKKLKLFLIATVILTLFSVSVFATFPDASSQSTDISLTNKNAILLKNAYFDTTTVLHSKVTPSIFNVLTYPDSINDYYIVQFRGNIKDEMKQAVMNTGAVIFDYVPNNAFIVQMDPATKRQVESLDEVQWVGLYQPAYRISPALSAQKKEMGTSELIYENVTILLFNVKDNGRVSSEIRRFGGEIVESSDEMFLVRIESSKVSELSTINGVSWIEKYVEPVILNDIAANITNVYSIRNTHGLTGYGQIVAIADTGLDTGIDDSTMHDDIEGRISALFGWWDDNANDKHGHGTHVTGSVLGNGSNSNGRYAGMAPEARLVFQAMQYDGSDPNYDGKLLIPLNLDSLFQEAYDEGAKIHSNSWGYVDPALYGNYTSFSQYVDDFMWNNPDMVIVFAAGNYGPDDNTLISPGTAKNAITVGASQSSRFGSNINSIASFSSRGPTDDGRIKPDVVAPGTWILSTWSSQAPDNASWGIYNEYYGYSGGTSMATPLTSGMATLVRQYYVDNESILPSAALIKATLINGAIDLGLSSNAQGWGRVDITNSLFPESPSSVRYHDENSGLNTSHSWNVSYYVANSTTPLRITLVWTDYKGLPGAAVELVNDLDMMVTGPSGSYFGNGGDNINNVEPVKLVSPLKGKYTIFVNGTNIPQGPQPFALVMSGGVTMSPFGYVNGSVVDNVTKIGIGGSVVSIDTGGEIVTNESGGFSFYLEEGLYNLSATSGFEYYPNSSVSVEVLSDATVEQDIKLTRKPVGTISGGVANV